MSNKIIVFSVVLSVVMVVMTSIYCYQDEIAQLPTELVRTINSEFTKAIASEKVNHN